MQPQHSPYWEAQFTEIGAFWYHDGHPRRPYVELTSPDEQGRPRFSNGYFNGHVVQEHAALFGQACTALAMLARESVSGTGLRVPYVIAAEKGGIALSARIGEALGFNSAYAEKQPDGSLAFERFKLPSFGYYLLAEDTITSGGTLHKLVRAAHKKTPECAFAPIVLALCDRSNLTRFMVGSDDYRIVPLVKRPMQIWSLGENPFTKEINGGNELVRPVKAKMHWHELTRPYD